MRYEYLGFPLAVQEEGLQSEAAVREAVFAAWDASAEPFSITITPKCLNDIKAKCLAFGNYELTQFELKDPE